jgi:hypothetical protein
MNIRGTVKEIKLMGRRDFDLMTALEMHKSALQGEVERLNRLIRTVDKTILHLKGEKWNQYGWPDE